MTINMLLTNGGAAALAQASQVGPVVLSEIAIGSANWTPTAAATALQSEIKRLTAVDGGNVGGQIHMAATDGSADIYTVNELGIYTDQGVLFAVYSSPSGTIFDKVTADTLFLALDIAFVNVPASAPITVTGDANFLLPLATTTKDGIVRIHSGRIDQNGDSGVVTSAAYIEERARLVQFMDDKDTTIDALIRADMATIQAEVDVNTRRRPTYRYFTANGGTVPGGGGDWVGVIQLDGVANNCVVYFTGEHYGAGGVGGMTFQGKANTATVFTGSCDSPDSWSSFAAVSAYTLNSDRTLDITFAGVGSVRNLRCVVIEFPD